MNRMRRERGRKGLTQAELAERAGVGVNTVIRMEQGDARRAHVKTLWRVARALDVDVEDLMEKEGA